VVRTFERKGDGGRIYQHVGKKKKGGGSIARIFSRIGPLIFGGGGPKGKKKKKSCSPLISEGKKMGDKKICAHKKKDSERRTRGQTKGPTSPFWGGGGGKGKATARQFFIQRKGRKGRVV